MRGKFYGVDHAPCPGRFFFATQMLTRDLFAVDDRTADADADRHGSVSVFLLMSFSWK